MISSIKPQRIFQLHTSNLLDVWLRDFLLDVRAANRSEATVEFYREKLRRFIVFLEKQGIADPSQITAQHLRSFLVELQQGRSAGGVHAHWRAVRAFIGFLVREDVLERNPLEKIRSPKVDQELLEPVTPDVIHALLSTCDKSNLGRRDRAIILMLLDTGLSGFLAK